MAALIRTVHEVFATVGFFALFQLDFNLPAIAALLALAGYSINDTVVVFDRIRENLQRRINPDFRVVINASINQTLRRTILLSTAVELVLAPLILYGGRTLYSFSVSMAWGVALGTFTSICAAGPLLLYLKPRYATVPVEA